MSFRQIKFFFIICSLFVAFIYSEPAKAELNPRLKALLLMSTYGTVGGALLGTAALAFDARGRSPFIGASLGLYMGMLFGSYVVIGHAVKTKWKGDDYYPDTPASPYEKAYESNSYFYDNAPAAGAGDNQAGFEAPAEQRWDPYWINEYSEINASTRSQKQRPRFFLSLLNYQF